MIDISMVEKLKKKLEALKKFRASIDIEVAKKEAVINDTIEKLKSEYGIETIEEGKEVLISLKASADKLESEISSRLEEADKLLGGMS